MINLLSVRVRTLWVLGCISASIYALVAAIFWTDAIFDPSGAAQTLLYALGGGLTILYFAGIPFVRETRLRTVVAFAALFAIIGFISGPVDSTDVFFYMAQGWGQTHYDVNPYTQVLREIPNGLADPMIGSRWMGRSRNLWLDEPMPYGFAFALVTQAMAWLGGGNWWTTLFLFALLNLAFHAAIAYLLWKTVRLVSGADPKLVLYLYMWSPLVVLQFLADVHNDLIMAGLILLAFHFWMNKRAGWVFPTLILAGFVKYVAFALAPFALSLVLRRHGWKAALRSVGVSAALTVLISLPYMTRPGTFKIQEVFNQLTEKTGSLHAFVRFTFRSLSGLVHSGPVNLDGFSTAASFVLWGLVATFTLHEFLKSWPGRRDEPRDVASRWTSVMFAVIFVGSSQFYPWYIGMLFPLSLVTAGTSLLTEIIVLMSGTHLAFTFLRSKIIGYFILSTIVPVVVVLWHRKRGAVTALISKRTLKGEYASPALPEILCDSPGGRLFGHSDEGDQRHLQRIS